MPRADISPRFQDILADFIFADCRLADSPSVRASVFVQLGENLQLVARTPKPRAEPLKFASSAGLVGKVFTSKAYGLFPELNIATAKQYLFRPETGHHTPIQSLLAAPILTGSTAHGTVSLDSPERGFFHDRHVGQVQLLAGLIAYVALILNLRERSGETATLVGSALRRVRLGLGLTQTTLAQKINTSRIALSRWEAGAQPPSYGPFRLWCEALGVLRPKSQTTAQIMDVSARLLPLLRADPQLLGRLSPEQFEHVVAERLDRMGYEVSLTGATNRKDGAIDIIATPRALAVGRFLLAAQVKHHGTGKKAGSRDVRELLAWENSAFRLGLVVTNTEFTADARWVGEQHKAFLRLRDFHDLKRWLEGHFQSEQEWREIPDRIELAPGVWFDIPKPQNLTTNEIWTTPRL